MHRTTRRIAALAIALSIGAAACGGTDDTASTTDGDGPVPAAGGDAGASGGCAVVSADEVTEIAGVEISDTTPMGTGCQWAVGSEGASYDWQSLPPEAYEANKASATQAGFEVEAVDGLGTEAFLRLQVSPDGEVLNGETWVLLGDTAFQVRTAGIAGRSDTLLAAQRQIAELLAQRL